MQAVAIDDKNYRANTFFVLMLCIGLLNGCQNMVIGEAAKGRNPREKPSINITTFSESLECMDDMLSAYDLPPVTITAQHIPHLSGDPNTVNGAKEMLITSLSSISEKSKKIKFVSFGSDLTDILALHRGHKKKDLFKTPDYFIRGGITQLDKNVISSRIGMGLNQDEWNSSFSGGQGVSYAALDLNVGTIADLQMISGVTSHNVLGVYSKGLGGDLGGRINSVGLFFDFGVDRRDGLGQAVRNLIDLGVIEIVGKMFDLPYMMCLPLDYSQAQVVKQINKEYNRYSVNKKMLVKAIQFSLRKNEFYNGKIDGILGNKTQLALQYYQRYSGDTSKGVDLSTYKTMLYGFKPDQGGIELPKSSKASAVAFYKDSQITQVDSQKVVLRPTEPTLNQVVSVNKVKVHSLYQYLQDRYQSDSDLETISTDNFLDIRVEPL